LLPGRKKEKIYVTVYFYYNLDGSKKLPLWFIGTAKKPRAFLAARIHIKNLNICWHSNKKAWMTIFLIEEWLCWFNNQIRGQKVVLLIDNFSTYEAAAKAIRLSLNLLQNIIIIWLLLNSISRY
jgi:hypothetical protein